MSYIPHRCNERRQARTITSISLIFGMLLLATPSHADPSFLIDGISISIYDYFDIFVLHPDDNRDVDEDMLNDDFENDLAYYFAPYIRFDSNENTVQWALGEPHIVYQVTPVNADDDTVHNDGMLVKITYQYLFSDDGGWGSCSAAGGAHKGDNPVFYVYVVLQETRAVFLYAVAGASQRLCNVRHPGSSSSECREGRTRTFFVDDRVDKNWSGWSSSPWTGPGRSGSHIALFLSEDKHHQYLMHWGACNNSWYSGGPINKEEKADGMWPDIGYPHSSEMYNVGEFHKKDWPYPFSELDIIAGDAYLHEIYNITPAWNWESDWDNEHLWNTGHFLGTPVGYPGWDGCSSLASRWTDESPHHGDDWFNFDGDSINDRPPRTWDEWLDDWDDETLSWDRCPMGGGGIYGTQADEITDSDGDGWGDGCDRCPELDSYDQVDPDADGVFYGMDNCECDYNPLQHDCDGDGVGDACDPDKCIYFVENGINSVTCYYGSWHIFCFTPGLMPITYATDGDDSLGVDNHDAQLRWCDCFNPDYDPLDPFSEKFYSVFECMFFNCYMTNLQNEYSVHFDHERWHMSSLDGDNTLMAQIVSWPNGEAGHAPRVDCDGATFFSTWTQFGQDSQVTDLWTYHCGPKSVNYSATGSSAEHTTKWDWPWEIWWREVEQSDTAPFLEPDPATILTGGTDLAHVHYWIRPEWDDGEVLPIDGQINKYEAVTLINPTIHFTFIKDTIWGQLPYIYKGCPHPFDLVGGEIGHDYMSSVLPQFSEGMRVVLGAISPNANPMSMFEYPVGLAGEDAAIGGMVHIMAGTHSLETGAMAYGTGLNPGAVPNTVDFSFADFAFDAPVGMQATSAQTDSPRSGRKLAVFGGRLASGALGDRLWIGEFAGLDDNGVPYFMWRDATPFNGEIPSPRAGALLFFDRYEERLVLIGGEIDQGEIGSDVWAFDVFTEEWTRMETPRGMPRLFGASVMPFGARAYVAGGKLPDGSSNTAVYELDMTRNRVREIGDLLDGPGERSDISFAMSAVGSPRLFSFGGVDLNGGAHTDMWELDLATESWTLVRPDCAGVKCPVVSNLDTLMTDGSGEKFALYAGNDPGNRIFFKTGRFDDTWIPSDELHPPPPVLDCDGDGTWDPEATKACRETGEWYASIGTFGCPNPDTGEISCQAPADEPMSFIAEWSPDGWEWVVDFERSQDAIYVLTGRSLYSFDPVFSGTDLQPEDEIPLEMPGPWGWGSMPDPSFSLELSENRLYVGSWSGVHVFDISDPLYPIEVGYMPTWAPVSDVKSLGDVIYLADGFGVTAVDVTDPTSLADLGYTDLGGIALRLDTNLDDWSLTALTSNALIKLRLSDPAAPVETDRVGLVGFIYWDIKTEGRWTYLSGLSTQSVWNDPDGLEKRGTHDVRAWTAGRTVADGRVYRLRHLANSLEVWGSQ